MLNVRRLPDVCNISSSERFARQVINIVNTVNTALAGEIERESEKYHIVYLLRVPHIM